MSLPVIRSHERIDYKRCPKKWYWKWRKGLVPKEKSFGALELGTWYHDAFAHWYKDKSQDLAKYFNDAASYAIRMAKQAGASSYQLEKADEIAALGEIMATAYQRHYGDDPGVNVIDAEIPLEVEITDGEEIVAIHKLKPDLIYADNNGYVWLMEHKTAAQIRLEHLVIDDQARPYAAMAEMALRKAGLLLKNQIFKGVMYNFSRKAIPDERPTDAQGRSLNKNGTVSKKQPSPVFIRHAVELTRPDKRMALMRLRTEARLITVMAQAIREKKIDPRFIPITPHSSCPKLCPYFRMCVVAEQGGNTQEMQRSLYVQRDPYQYDEETTDIPTSFELS